MKAGRFLTLIRGLCAAVLAGCGRPTADVHEQPVIRLGHFPNITHVQALVAHQLSRQGRGWFEQRLGVEVHWFIYNAGPSATEAFFAKSLDAAYVGPSPVLNAYARSRGAEMRVLAGAAKGGSALVVRPGSGIQSVADLKGKRIATPQLGNTQDVQLRACLADHGFQVTLTGGDAFVLPTQNADQLPLFHKGHLDAVWSVEPWVSRLELEAGAQVLIDDRDTAVTLLAASAAFVNGHPDLARKLVAAHCELTRWIQEHPAAARALLKAELTELLRAAPEEELIERSLERIALTSEVSRAALEQMVAGAQRAGFLRRFPALDPLFPEL